MTAATTHAVLALGSNLGDRAATLAQALDDLVNLPGAAHVVCSALYESAAVTLTGVDDGAPRYINAVVTLEYQGDAYALLDAVNAIEAAHGRVREERWGARTLDIDLITFGTLLCDDNRLTLPHPRAGERDFVVVPWLELEADAVLPGRGSIRALPAAHTNAVHRVADAPWTPPASKAQQ